MGRYDGNVGADNQPQLGLFSMCGYVVEYAAKKSKNIFRGFVQTSDITS